MNLAVLSAAARKKNTIEGTKLSITAEHSSQTQCGAQNQHPLCRQCPALSSCQLLRHQSTYPPSSATAHGWRHPRTRRASSHVVSIQATLTGDCVCVRVCSRSFGAVFNRAPATIDWRRLERVAWPDHNLPDHSLRNSQSYAVKQEVPQQETGRQATGSRGCCRFAISRYFSVAPVYNCSRQVQGNDRPPLKIALFVRILAVRRVPVAVSQFVRGFCRFLYSSLALCCNAGVFDRPKLAVVVLDHSSR